jgi:hypothetical protein
MPVDGNDNDLESGKEGDHDSRKHNESLVDYVVLSGNIVFAHPSDWG